MACEHKEPEQEPSGHLWRTVREAIKSNAMTARFSCIILILCLPLWLITRDSGIPSHVAQETISTLQAANPIA